MDSMEGNGGSRLVVTELSHIKELVKQLEVQLGGSPELCKHLASQIFSLTERSIGMIKSGSFDGRKRVAGDAGLDSPLSTTPSPLSDVSDVPFKTNKKRKTMEKQKYQITVSSTGGAETPVEDGHSWRKYGQKEILGAKHPRGYYRCTHRNSQGCVATKQVQRTDEDPTLFNVIYHGTHTCVQKAVAGQAAAAGKNQPLQNPDAHSLLQSMSSSLTVKTEGLATEPQDWSTMPFCFSSPVTVLAPEHNPFSTPSTPEIFAPGVSLSPSLVLPATSDSNHLSMAPFHVAGDVEWCAQSELQEVVSALVAVTSTPVPAMETDFSADGFEFDPSFTIDVSSFFP